jgi:uncharacterized protein (DUF1800 family)
MYLTYTKSIDPAWAWAPYSPSAKEPWNLAKAGHLYRRAAFGGSWNDLQTAVKEGPAATIDKLLAGGATTDDFYTRAARLADPLAGSEEDDRLRAWWLYVLLNTPHPLLEKLTLFWHNHFATSNAKVQNVGAMYRQNELFRKHALGRFGPMLQEVSKDPAMMLWLDTVVNKRGKPNENYARELMELFSLGVGNYTEHDIREAARAFTGWEVRNEKFFFHAEEHDTGPKTVFGRTGKFKGEDIVQFCLDKPACALFLVRKLVRYFVSETLNPEDRLLELLATKFRESGYDIKVLVGVILRSNLFFSPDSYRARVKPPIEFAVGIIHALEGRADTLQLREALDPLGQRLFAPPSVKGWDGGPTWLNSNTLLMRHNLALALTSTEDRRFFNRCDPVRLVAKHLDKAGDLQRTADFLENLFLQGDIPADTRSKINDRMTALRNQKYPPYWTPAFVTEYQSRAICHLILTLPEYQLS